MINVPLSQVLNELFSEENLERSQHIQYVVNLVSEGKTDQFLAGLSLDQIEFDVNIQPDLRLEKLTPSRENTVDRTPVVWYINSISQLNDDQENVKLWNILILKAAIYLIALPTLQPDLFKADHTEHFNTVKRLFNRIRSANKALSGSRNYQNLDNYKRFWEELLPDPRISLENFIKYLQDLSESKELDEFDKNLLNNIRIAFNYALKNKAKVSRESHEQTHTKTQTKTPTRFLDEEELIEETIDILNISKNRALNLENQLDFPEKRLITSDPSHVSPIAAHSENIQKYFSHLIGKHIQRKEHLLATSNCYPNHSSIQNLLQHLYRDYKNAEKESLILLLMFLTGNSASEWLKAQNARVKILNSRQTIVYHDEAYFLSSKFSIYDNKDFKFEGLLNDTVSLELPIPKEFIIALRTGPKIEIEAIHKKIRALRIKFHIPKLSPFKVNSLLHHRIFHFTGDKQLADILLGIDANQDSSISYCHRKISELQEHYISTIQQLNQNLGEIYRNLGCHSNLNFGSRKAPQPAVVTNIYNILAIKLYEQAENDWIEKLNHYSIWMWHVLLLFTAARPVNDFPGLLSSFNFTRKILFISDKEIGGRQGDGRIIPLCDYLIQEVQNYLKFLKKIKIYLRPNTPDIEQHVQAILESKLPLLTIFKKGQWQTLSPSVIQKTYGELGLDHANWHRHTARAFLTNRVAEIEILALFGHEQSQQEAAHQYSSLPFSQFKKIADVLEQMKVEFKIPEININVLI